MEGKAERLRIILDKLISEHEAQIPALTMLKPILTGFITTMKDEDVDGLILFIKKIITYLEDGDVSEKN